MINNAHILFDTNILSNLLSNIAELRHNTWRLINLFQGSTNKLYLSVFSGYELLRDLKLSKKRQCYDLMSTFISVPNSTERLLRATKLYSGYKSVPNIKSMMHGISDVDIFIGSLIFTKEKPYLLTSDYTDFPRPFFREIKQWSVTFKTQKGKQRTIHYNLLQADLHRFRYI